MNGLLPTEGSEFCPAAIKECLKLFDDSDDTEMRILPTVQPTFRAVEPFAVRTNKVVALAAEEIRTSFPDLFDWHDNKASKGRSRKKNK